MNKLKPCPFCGSQPERVYKSTGQTTHIECPGCRAQFPKSTCGNKYDDAWNARAATTIGKVQVEIEPIAATLGCEVNGDTSDGYHTFDELYYHRTALFACLVALQPRQMAFKSRKHADGTMYDGMFIAGIYTSGGWCTYHCEDRWWPLFDCSEREFAPEWDGHTPSDAIHRLMSDFLPKQEVRGETSE